MDWMKQVTQGESAHGEEGGGEAKGTAVLDSIDVKGKPKKRGVTKAWRIVLRRKVQLIVSTVIERQLNED